MLQNLELVKKKRKEREIKTLITELELCATGIRDVLCQLFIEQLKKYDIKCTHELFLRSTAECDFLKMITFFLKENKTLSESKLKKIAPSLLHNLQEAFIEKVEGFDIGIKKLFDELSGLNIRLAFISLFLSEEYTRRFADKLHLPSNALYFPFPYDNEPYLNINKWLKMAKDMKIQTHNCFAIVSCRKSCCSALSAGIPCAAIVDKYTAWHDFSGADIILDSLSSTNIKNLLAFLLQKQADKK